MTAITLILARILLGVSFMGHGSQKLFGWLGGHGFTTTAQQYANGLGMRPGWLFALLADGWEFGGSLLLVLVLLTPLGALLILATMVVAIAQVTGKKGYWITGGGWEYNALIIGVCVLLLLAGTGTYSLDHVIGWNNNVADILHVSA